MSNECFEIEEAIEEYGIKNIRVFYPAVGMKYDMANITLASMCGMVLTSDSDPKNMIMHTVDEEFWKERDGFKIRLLPEDRYTTIYTHGEKVIEIPGYLPSRRMYSSDFNKSLQSGRGRVYLKTEDGYDLLFGVIDKVTSVETTRF